MILKLPDFGKILLPPACQVQCCNSGRYRISKSFNLHISRYLVYLTAVITQRHNALKFKNWEDEKYFFQVKQGTVNKPIIYSC